MNIAQLLVVGGAGLLGFLGLLHAWATARSSPGGGPMTPTDRAVQDAMRRPGGLGLAPALQVPLWAPWVGFNHSHSLGTVVSAAVIGIPAVRDFGAATQDPLWLAAATVLPLIYFTLSINYWFSAPTRAIGLGAALIYAGLAVTLAT